MVEARVATVDTENAGHPTTLTRAEMDELPTGRYMQSIASYVPGAHLNLPDIGGSQQIEQNYISVHGAGSVHDSYYLDGMKVNTTYADGQIQQYIDNAAIQETTYAASNVGADVSAGGMFTNLIPKDGGNQYHVTFFGGLSGGSDFWQANNLNANTTARGLTSQDKTVKIEDYDGSFSGPIKTNKLWFVLTGREQITFTQAGASVYPDGKPGIQDGYLYNGTIRLTYQMNPKNKFAAFYERNFKYKGHEILDGGQTYLPVDPAVASTQRNKWPMYYILQSRWTGTLTPKLITQAGVSISHLDYNDLYQQGVLQAPGTDAFYADTSQIDTGTLRRYIAGTGNTYYQTTRNDYNGTVSYVTGSHQIKAGVEFSNGRNDNSLILNGDGISNFTNGVPVSFTAYNSPYSIHAHLAADAGLFLTDTWHYKRLAITAGIRWEYLAARVDPEIEPAGRFAPARTVAQIDCSTVKGMGCWHDWVPRLGAVYDVFGNHKTAIKAGFGKANTPYSSSFTGIFNPLATQTEAVTWNVNTNPALGPVLNPAISGQNCTPVTIAGVIAPNPDCYPVGGFAPQGTPSSAVLPGHLGPSSNPLFGAVTGATTGVNLDPNWHRDYGIGYNLGVSQEVRRGVTMNFTWYRRTSYQEFFMVNENGVPATSWTPFSIVNPLNGTPITVFNLSPTLTALPVASLLETNAPQSLARNTYTGYETSVVARLSRGAFATFGWTADRQLDRSCAENVSVSKPLADPNTLRYCDLFGSSSLTFQGINIASLGAVNPPWAQAFTGQGSMPIHWGIVGSLSFISNQYQGGFAGAGGTGTLNNGYLGRTIAISSKTASVYPNGSVGVAPSLAAGATCATSGPTVGCPIDPGYNALQGTETINLTAPGAVRTARLNQLDLSVKRTFKFREKYILEPTIQVFNLLNTNAAVVQSTSIPASYSATSPGVAPFLTPQQCAASPVGSFANCGLGGAVTTITNPRLLKVALLFRF